MADSEPRILLFAGPFELRGTCAYTMKLMEYLPESGFSTSVFCDNARLLNASETRKATIFEYHRLATPLWGQAVRYGMLRDARAAKPELIHIQSRGVLNNGQWLARQLQCPYVITVHDHLHTGEPFRIDLDWCRKVIAVSDSVKEHLVEQGGLPEEFVSVIHTGVAEPVHGGAGPSFESGHVPVVGTVGPLEAVKGFPFFLSAAQQVLSTGKDAEFLIAGAGPEEYNLRRLARELGISEKVTFVPTLLDLSEFLTALDVFCLPSLQQGLGTIMLEPMSMGIPVIATRVGGVYSVVEDGQTGLLVPPSDSTALADQIVGLLSDPQRARTIGQAGRARVLAEFGVDKMMKQTIELYRSLLDSPAPVEAVPAYTSH